jgi:hypothetical protein
VIGRKRLKRRAAVALTSVTVQRDSGFARAAAIFAVSLIFFANAATAEPIGWPQPNGPGSPVYITYSYSNLLDGTFFLTSPAEFKAATEEALRLWAAYAPLNFIEVPDSGPPSSDVPYSADLNPQIRIGHQVMADLAHAYFPGEDGLAGDVLIATGIPWTIGDGHWNFLEAIAHELGHAIGLEHELVEPAIMNPSYPFHRFQGLGTGFLFPADIRAEQRIYGVGVGSVQPLDLSPEPTTYVLVGGGLFALFLAGRGRMRRRHRACSSQRA